MDIKPVLSKYALIKYLSKYLTKGEPHNETLKELTEKLLHQTDSQEREQMIERGHIPNI